MVQLNDKGKVTHATLLKYLPKKKKKKEKEEEEREIKKKKAAGNVHHDVSFISH